MEKKELPPGFQAQQIRPLDLPIPSAFRELRPAVLGTPPVTAKARLFERKRVVVGFAVAVVFHLSLGIAWWLTPPLRLKASYAADRWVPILSLPASPTLAPPPPLHPAPPVQPLRQAPTPRPKAVPNSRRLTPAPPA